MAITAQIKVFRSRFIDDLALQINVYINSTVPPQVVLSQNIATIVEDDIPVLVASVIFQPNDSALAEIDAALLVANAQILAASTLADATLNAAALVANTTLAAAASLSEATLNAAALLATQTSNNVDSIIAEVDTIRVTTANVAAQMANLCSQVALLTSALNNQLSNIANVYVHWKGYS